MDFINGLVWLLCAVAALNEVQCKTILTFQEAQTEIAPEDNTKGSDAPLSPEDEGINTIREDVLYLTDDGKLTEMNYKRKRSLPGADKLLCVIFPSNGFSGYQNVSYRLVNEPSYGNSTGLSKSILEELVDRAMAAWAPYCGLHFTKQEYGQADIMISFEQADHWTRDPSNPYNVIFAHTKRKPTSLYQRCYIHINDAGGDDLLAVIYKNSSLNDNKNLFYNLVLHEIGHALGLDHLLEKSTVMYANLDITYPSLHISDIQPLHNNDKRCMRAFYRYYE